MRDNRYHQRRYLRLRRNFIKDLYNIIKRPILTNYHIKDLRKIVIVIVIKKTPAVNPPINASPRTCAKSNPKSNKTQECSNTKTSPKAPYLKTPPINESTKLTIKAFTTLIINASCLLPHSSIMTRITIGFCRKIQGLVVGTMCRRLKIFIKNRITPRRLMPRECKKSRKVFIMKVSCSKIILNMIRRSPGKRLSPYRILRKSKGFSNKRTILKVWWYLKNHLRSSFSRTTLI